MPFFTSCSIKAFTKNKKNIINNIYIPQSTEVIKDPRKIADAGCIKDRKE